MRKIDADALIAKIASLDRIVVTDSQKSLLGRVMYIVSKMPTSRAEPGWISVEDRLPEIRHAVLVYTPHYSNIWAASLHENGDWYFWMPGTMRYEPNWYGPITHWMPLPEAPKEEHSDSESL